MTNSEKPKSINHLWTIVAFLVLAILLVVSYKLKDLLSPDVAAVAELDESCELRKGECVSKLPNGGTVSFSMAPNDIPILRPLKLDVKIDGIKAESVEVDFVGIGMEMGYNRAKLDANPVSTQQFSGKAILPVCVRAKMEWEARVLLQTDKGTIMAPFRFFTLK